MNSDGTSSSLPSVLLHAIGASGGGRVVLVLGAGCSNEGPTSLPLAGELSENCYRQLVAEGVLSEGGVNNTRDLSEVAEAVYQEKGSQRVLIDQFPPDEFMNAQPNDGYLIMASLLLEGALGDTLTLNFDNAARNALVRIGARAQVSTIRGPEDHRRLGNRNIIYLHRSIEASPDTMIVRTSQLEDAWQDSWEEVIAQRVLAAPVVVFVGLGTPASVVIQTTKRIRESMCGFSAESYVVDPIAYERSEFASALDSPRAGYLQMGWGDFMRALARRVVARQRSSIEDACEYLAQQSGIQTENVESLCDRLEQVGLPGLGHLRAAWLLDDESYLPHPTGAALRPFSDLVLAVRMVERTSGWQAQFCVDGLVEFCKGNQVVRAMICHGSGSMSAAMIDVTLRNRRECIQPPSRAPSFALVAGATQGSDIATPTDIALENDPDDLVAGPEYFATASIAELRAEPSLVRSLIR